MKFDSIKLKYIMYNMLSKTFADINDAKSSIVNKHITKPYFQLK